MFHGLSSIDTPMESPADTPQTNTPPHEDLTQSQFYFDYFVRVLSLSNIIVNTSILGRLAQVRRDYADILRPKFEHAKKLRAKYEPRLARALWRKRTHYPLADPLHYQRWLDVADMYCNDFGPILCERDTFNCPIVFITGISFLTRSQLPIQGFIASGTSDQHNVDFKCVDFEPNPGGVSGRHPLVSGAPTPQGAYKTTFDIRHCPFASPTSYAWLFVGDIYSATEIEHTVCDTSFIRANVSHIIVHFEMLKMTVPAAVPFSAPSREEMKRLIDNGTVIRCAYHYYAASHTFPDRRADFIEHARTIMSAITPPARTTPTLTHASSSAQSTETQTEQS